MCFHQQGDLKHTATMAIMWVVVKYGSDDGSRSSMIQFLSALQQHNLVYTAEQHCQVYC